MKKMMIIERYLQTGRCEEELHICAWCQHDLLKDLPTVEDYCTIRNFLGPIDAKRSGWIYAKGFDLFGDDDAHWVCPECAVDIMKYKRKEAL